VRLPGGLFFAVAHPDLAVPPPAID